MLRMAINGLALPSGAPAAGVMERLTEISRAVQRATPEELLWGVWPAQGRLEPIPAGQTIIDLRKAIVTTPAGTSKLELPNAVAESAQSFVFSIDQVMTVTPEPGAGAILLSPGVLESDARNIDRLIFESATPYLMQVIFGSGMRAADFRPQGWWQWRYHTSTITKTAAAGNADAFAAVAFTVRDGAAILDQAVWGSSLLLSAGFAQKAFTVRNTGPGDINVRIVGSMIPEVGVLSGFIEDPDAGQVTVASGEEAVLETGLPWGATMFEARVDEAEAAAVDADIEIEYIGMSYVAR